MIATDTICAPNILLSESLDKYLALRGVERKKYYAKYLIAAGKVWEEIFQKTIYSVKGVWKELKAGDPYNYIDKPSDCSRLFSVSTLDECGNIQPIYYNEQLNVIPKPTVKKCGCTGCNCGGLCEELNSTTLLTKEVFTINGTIYYEKTWLKYCPNGDIVEYKETPVKKYNDFIGDTGDFNQDYNNDYLIGNPLLSNFTIITVNTQKTLCSLATEKCGCPQDTEENDEKVKGCCIGYFPFFGLRRKKHCDQFLQNINNNHRGEVKMSDCGTRIYFRPGRHWKKVTDQKYPDFLLVSYQTNGKIANGENQIPDYAEVALWSGVDYFTKRYNNIYSYNDKEAARIDYIKEQNEIIKFLNPLDLNYISQIQDVKIQW
jgi:hypothetical protein